MASFQDTHGRGWNVHLDLAALDRLRDGGFDVAAGGLALIAPRVFRDPLRMILFVYRLVSPQCQLRRLSADDFWRLATRSYGAVWHALVDALDEFDPQLGLHARLEMSQWH